jgi:hypothetical protein
VCLPYNRHWDNARPDVALGDQMSVAWLPQRMMDYVHSCRAKCRRQSGDLKDATLCPATAIVPALFLVAADALSDD